MVTQHLYSNGPWTSYHSNNRSAEVCQGNQSGDTESHRLLYAGPSTWRIEYSNSFSDDTVVTGSDESGHWVCDPKGNIDFMHHPALMRDRRAIDELLILTIFPIRALPGMKIREIATSECLGMPTYLLELEPEFEEWSLLPWSAERHVLQVDSIHGVLVSSHSYWKGRIFAERLVKSLAVNVKTDSSCFSVPNEYVVPTPCFFAVVLTGSLACSGGDPPSASAELSQWTTSIPYSPPEVPDVRLLRAQDGQSFEHAGAVVYSAWHWKDKTESSQMSPPIQWPVPVKLRQNDPLKFFIPAEKLPFSLNLFAYRDTRDNGMAEDLIQEIYCLSESGKEFGCTTTKESAYGGGWVVLIPPFSDSRRLYISLSASWLGVEGDASIQSNPIKNQNEAAWLFVVERQ